jgi:predicted nucleic acid-binding protein
VTITYLDSGVLIAIVRGTQPIADRAIRVLEDVERTFVASAFLRLQLLPKALFHANHEKSRFYNEFFGQVSTWSRLDDVLIEAAEELAALHGLNALDALHVAAATSLGAEHLVTTEGPDKPIHRGTHVQVMSL